MDLGKCPQGFTVQHKSLVQKKKIVQRRNGATDLFHENMKYIDNEWNDFRSHIESRENKESFLHQLAVFNKSFHSRLVNVFPVVTLLAKS